MTSSSYLARNAANIKKSRKNEAKRVIRGYLFLLPFLILFSVFTLWPVIQSFLLSFTNYNMIQAPKFIGLDNYQVLFMEDTVFRTALVNTLIFALIVGPVGYILSFLLAYAINNMRYKTLFTLSIYAPSITSSVAMTVIWMYFFSPDKYGIINSALLKLGVLAKPILWTQDPQFILPAIMFISIWMSMGNNFLVFLAGLKNVPEEYYEVGDIEGADSAFRRLIYIVLPTMKPQLLFGAINSVIASFGVYDVAVAFAGIPSPQYAGHTIVTHLYDAAFVRLQMGYASVVAVFLFLMTFILGRILLKALREK